MTKVRLGAAGVTRRFDTVLALDDVTLSVTSGEIHALLGENGAGKTTLIRTLSGLDHPDEGSVVVDDDRVKFAGPRDAFAAGIGVIQQEFALSPQLTMLENLVLGMEPTRGARIDWAAARNRGEEIAESIGAIIPWDEPAHNVAVGSRQQLEIVRVIYRGADTLILDEPSAVLAPSQIDKLLGLLKALRDSGKTIVFITHKLDEVRAVADRVTVLRGGRVVTTQRTSTLDREELAELVVGERVTEARNARDGNVGASVVLDARDVRLPGRQREVGPVSLEVRQGEVLGLAGVAGNGQDELLEALAGVRPITAGTVTLNGREISRAPVDVRRSAGLGYVSADRKGEGLSVTESLVTNVTMGRHRAAPVCPRRMFRPRRARELAVDVLDRYGVRYGGPGDPASALSGGNQQKVVVARELALEPTVLLAAQPTRGVDVKGIRDLHAELLNARDRGVAVLLLSQELDELLAVADRVMVMYSGQLNGTFDPGDPDALRRIGAAMLGSTSTAAAKEARPS